MEHSKGQNSRETKPFQLVDTDRESVGFLAKSIWQSCQNCIPCEQSNFWNKLGFFSKKNAVLILFPNFLRKTYIFLENGHVNGVKSATFTSAKTSEEKLDEPGRLSTCPAERSTSSKNFWHKPKLFEFWAMNNKLPVSRRNVFKGVLNTTFHMSREMLWDKSVFFSKKSKFDIFFWFRMKKFRVCGRSFQQGCQRQNSRDQRKFLVKLRLEEYTTLNLLMVFVRKICFGRKLPVRQ